MNDTEKIIADHITDQLATAQTELAQALMALPEDSRRQLSRSIGMVVAGFMKPGWKSLVITINEDQGALLLAASPGVTDIEANDIVDVAKDAIIASTTLDAPDRSKWS